MGWLEQYLEYTKHQESPDQFHLWSAIAVLGHVMGRRCWFERYYYKVFPAQIMVVLVSGSAVARKTTALEIPVRFLQYLPPWLVNPMPGVMSSESFLQGLDRPDPNNPGEHLDAVGLIVSDDLGAFLSKAAYTETLCTHINKLNTTCKEEEVIRFRSWEAVLKNPCVGMLAATTPTGFAEELPKAALTGGFLGRLLPIYEDASGTPCDLADPPPRMRELQSWLARDLGRIARIEGEYHFDDEAKAWWRRWYAEHFYWCKDHLTADDRESGWLGRKHDHLLRVAMVLGASQTSARVVTVYHLNAALILLDQLVDRLPQVTQEVGTRHAYAALSQRVIAAIKKFGAQSWSDLLRRMHRYGNKDTLRPEIETMVQSGLLERFTGPHGGEWFRLGQEVRASVGSEERGPGKGKHRESPLQAPPEPDHPEAEPVPPAE